ncbi:MAG: NAD-dependent succinate-semialdehyde dehydrogenase [Proteobacteria bacterium]|nr:MAG: NAD-dependent succinate-semialdehyde dehydrogenase [Pseudomonadota bacterium]
MSTPTITTIDPANGQKIESYPTHGPSEVERIFRRAANAFSEWRHEPIIDRAAKLKILADLLERDRTSLVSLMQQEMGKLAEEGAGEIDKCAACCRYYAESGPAFLETREIKTDAVKSYVAFEPIGTVLSIMPWNFPYWQAFRCLVPALLAGNTVVLKHASNVSGCALKIAELVEEAFERDDLFQVVLIPGKDALALVSRPEVSGVSFTGSTPVGREIAALAGRELKKAVLELGGSDAYVVLADADLEKAAKICANSRLLNAGQSCISAKRFIVEAAVYDRFEELFVAEMKGKKLAPLAREDLRDDLHEQVKNSVREGAKLLCGGELPKGEGNFYPPTVLSRVKPGMIAFDEETFGPVAALIEAKDAAEAVHLANQTSFGLGAAVFTKDRATGIEIAEKRLNAGSCFINALVKSDPRLPFGGTKQSGYGRELGEFGIHEFVNIKTVYLAE